MQESLNYITFCHASSNYVSCSIDAQSQTKLDTILKFLLYTLCLKTKIPNDALLVNPSDCVDAWYSFAKQNFSRLSSERAICSLKC